MKKKKILEAWKLRFKSVPQSLAAYFKNSVLAIDEAKSKRQYFASCVFIVFMFLCCSFLIGGQLLGVDYSLTSTGSVLRDMGLLDSVQTFSAGISFIFGLVFTFVMFFEYVLTRFVCVKLFARGSKAKTVLGESIIEFGMNSILLSVFFLLGGILSRFVWWTFYLLMLFVFLLFIVMLMRGIFDAVEREKQTVLLMLATALFAFIVFALILVLLILVLAYIVVTIALGVGENIQRIIRNSGEMIESVMDFFAGIIKNIQNAARSFGEKIENVPSFFKGIGNRFMRMFSR